MYEKKPATGRAFIQKLLDGVISLRIKVQLFMLSMLIITRPATVVMMTAVPASVGENDAAAQGKYGKQRNQQRDSTEYFKILMGQ
ncbi:hypothetical protein [Pseudomonas sp. ZS1P83]